MAVAMATFPKDQERGVGPCAKCVPFPDFFVTGAAVHTQSVIAPLLCHGYSLLVMLALGKDVLALGKDVLCGIVVCANNASNT